MTEHSFHKNERLKSRKSIEALFRYGKSIGSPPFRLFYREVDPLSVPARMTVAVPKRHIRRAVDRNLIKRRTREAYRLNKTILYKKCTEKNTSLELILLYQASEIMDYRSINKAVQFLLLKLGEKICE